MKIQRTTLGKITRSKIILRDDEDFCISYGYGNPEIYTHPIHFTIGRDEKYSYTIELTLEEVKKMMSVLQIVCDKFISKFGSQNEQK